MLNKQKPCWMRKEQKEQMNETYVHNVVFALLATLPFQNQLAYWLLEHLSDTEI